MSLPSSHHTIHKASKVVGTYAKSIIYVSKSHFVAFLHVFVTKILFTGSVPSYPTHQFMTSSSFCCPYALSRTVVLRYSDVCEGHR